MSKKEKIHPSELVNTFSPDGVVEEVKYNFVFSYPVEEFFEVRKTFKDTLRLFRGRMKGYSACDTPYHDINHTCDVFLALSRIIDGYNIKHSGQIPAPKAAAGLIAALLHDSGFIKKSGNSNFSGARYTLNHVQRSMDYAREYLSGRDCKDSFIGEVENFIEITDLNISINDVKFSEENNRLMAAMLGTADLIGQMAARTYLERLLFLYKEFREAGISGYKSEDDLLRKTITFYDEVVLPRMEKDFENVKKYTVVHFKKRYDIDEDLYTDSIESQLEYLKKVVKETSSVYRKKLRRTEGE